MARYASSCSLRDFFPTGFDLFHGLFFVDFTRQQSGNRRIEHNLLVALIHRNSQVEHHVGTVKAGLDGAQIILGRLTAHSGLDPEVQIFELGNTVRVKARDANSDIHIGLCRLAHIGKELIGSFFDFCVSFGTDAAGPAAESRKRCVVDTVYGMGAAA